MIKIVIVLILSIVFFACESTEVEDVVLEDQLGSELTENIDVIENEITTEDTEIALEDSVQQEQIVPGEETLDDIVEDEPVVVAGEGLAETATLLEDETVQEETIDTPTELEGPIDDIALLEAPVVGEETLDDVVENEEIETDDIFEDEPVVVAGEGLVETPSLLDDVILQDEIVDTSFEDEEQIEDVVLQENIVTDEEIIVDDSTEVEPVENQRQEIVEVETQSQEDLDNLEVEQETPPLNEIEIEEIVEDEVLEIEPFYEAVQVPQDTEQAFDTEPVLDNIEQPETYSYIQNEPVESPYNNEDSSTVFEEEMETIVVEDPYDNFLSYENEVIPDIPVYEDEILEDYDSLGQPTNVVQSLEVFVDDYVDIFLPGQGWIYLGEVHPSDPTVLEFYARYIDGDDTLFNFYVANQGSTILHFYKQDVLADVYLDEYVEVVVSDFGGQGTSSARIATNSDEMFGLSAEPEVNLVVGESEIAEERIFVAEDLLDEAQVAYDGKMYSESLSLLDEYTSIGVEEIDRALFLYGQNYEAISEIRNIKEAIASYEKLVQTFPDSTYWEEAQKRIVYLERFYVNIR